VSPKKIAGRLEGGMLLLCQFWYKSQHQSKTPARSLAAGVFIWWTQAGSNR